MSTASKAEGLLFCSVLLPLCCTLCGSVPRCSLAATRAGTVHYHPALGIPMRDKRPANRPNYPTSDAPEGPEITSGDEDGKRASYC